jgi:hypothetical protein
MISELDQTAKQLQDIAEKSKFRRVIESSDDTQLFSRLLRKIKSSIDVLLVRLYAPVLPSGD